MLYMHTFPACCEKYHLEMTSQGPVAKNARLRNMSLAAFGARMPYDEASGGFVGAKKVDRTGKVPTKTSLIWCKFWKPQVTSCFLGSFSCSFNL